VEYLLQESIEAIEHYDNALISYLVSNVNRDRFEIISPLDGPSRSTLVLIRPKRGRSRDLYQLLGRAGIDAALRREKVRFSPHLYNTYADIDRVISALNTL
jgi:selenocysteine lyase/cysteine desulfurase